MKGVWTIAKATSCAFLVANILLAHQSIESLAWQSLSAEPVILAQSDKKDTSSTEKAANQKSQIKKETPKAKEPEKNTQAKKEQTKGEESAEDKSLQELVNKGRSALKARKYKKALEFFTKSNEIKSTSSALQGMALSAFYLKKDDQAKEYGEIALQKDPDLWRVQVILAKIYIKEKKFDLAAKQIEKLVEQHPKSMAYWKQLAQCYRETGNSQGLVRVDQKILELGGKNVESHKRLAAQAMTQKDYKTALEHYQKLSKLTPKDAEIFSSMGDCQVHLANTKRAIALYAKAVKLNPDAVRIHKTLGDLYSQNKQIDKAMAAYKYYLDKAPKAGTDLAQKVGAYFYENKQYRNAAKYLGMVEGKQAGGFSHQLMLGDACFQSADFQRAASTYEDLLKSKPNLETRKKILPTLAQAYEKLGQRKRAAQAYHSYIQLKGVKDPNASYKYALLLEEPHPAAAGKVYLKNTKLFPNDYRNYYRLYHLYAKNRKTVNQAVAMLKKAALLTDSIPAVQLELGRMYANVGDREKELDAYKKHLELDPQSLEANKRVGVLLLERDRTSEGLVYLQMANTLTPKDPEVMWLLAKGYQKAERHQEAIKLLSKLEDIRKDDPEIIFELAKLYNETGKYKKADKIIKQLVEKTQRNKEYLFRYAELMLEEGKYNDAESAINDVLLTGPGDVQALELLAKIQMVQEQLDKATKSYRQILSRDPKHMGALVGMAKIARLERNSPKRKEYLQKAKQVDPKNEELKQELKQSMK